MEACRSKVGNACNGYIPAGGRFRSNVVHMKEVKRWVNPKSRQIMDRANPRSVQNLHFCLHLIYCDDLARCMLRGLEI